MAPNLSDKEKAGVCRLIDEYTSGENRRVPGLAYCAFGPDAEPIVQHFSGTVGMSSRRPMSPDTVFWLASFTKLATSIACMQLVERGILRLDDADQLESLSPELRDVKVLRRDEADGSFSLVDKTSRITLRMLLNHTGQLLLCYNDISIGIYNGLLKFLTLT